MLALLYFTFSMTSEVCEAKTETRVACHTILETAFFFAFYIKIHFLRKFTDHLDEVELKVLSIENLMGFTFTCHQVQVIKTYSVPNSISAGVLGVSERHWGWQVPRKRLAWSPHEKRISQTRKR